MCCGSIVYALMTTSSERSQFAYKIIKLSIVIVDTIVMICLVTLPVLNVV